MKETIVFILIALTFCSFKQNSKIDLQLLCKKWKISKVETKGLPAYHYSTINSMGNYPAYSFLKSGKLIVRQNVSWCGNAEVKYETVKGKWQFVSDSVIELKHKRYGSDSSRRLRILKLTEKELVFGMKSE